MTCDGCTGSGHQVAWLTYTETTRGNVTVIPDSPVLVGHPQLKEGRALAPDELVAFGTMVAADARGPLRTDGPGGVDAPLLRAQQAAVDPRLERVSFQQYLKLAVVRRDATYEMCGTTGVLVLSGGDLVGARTPGALRPIQRRLYLWLAAALGIFIAGCTAAGGLQGHTPYFDRTNLAVVISVSLAGLLALLFLGAALRALRPGFKFGPVTRLERFVGFGAVGGACLAVGISLAGRPRVAEVQAALAAGDMGRAKVVLDALVATKGEPPEVRDAEDAFTLAQAEKLSGASKLVHLDLVASRGGSKAVSAAQSARAERILEIQQAIDGKQPSDAIAKIEHWFPDWKADPEVASRLALAHDVAYASCTDDPCRFANATAAAAASASSDRTEKAAAAKAAMLTSLSFSEVPNEPLLSRLQRLGTVLALATSPAVATASDAEVAEKAKATSTWARGERAKVALVGSDEPVASELLGALAERDSKVATAVVDGIGVSVALDGQKKCRGVYLVGATAAARHLDASGEGTLRLLSQAVGHPSSVKAPAGDGTSSRWTEGTTPVVARWRGAQLMELRIGDASP